MKPSINQIMTTFMDCAGPRDFDSILRKFNAFNTEDRHWIRCRICRLVKQKYIIKVAVNEWMFNDAYRDLRARLDEEARRNFADSSL